MNKHIKPIELVENWLADNNSVSQEARTINAAAANAAAANDAYIADFWVAGYYKFIKEPNND